jgi:asparagine synthetase B (glutamine-hydrolysing)
MVTQRYWDPVSLDSEIDWMPQERIGEFYEHFDRAVERCLLRDKTGILLSGGIDSTSVALSASQAVKARIDQELCAYSIVFPPPREDESFIQREVASKLNLPQVLVPLDRTIDKNGFLITAFDINSRLPYISFSVWSFAYDYLYQIARESGINLLLTGDGGDEWLSVSPFLSADYIKNLEISNMLQLLKNYNSSFQPSLPYQVKRLFWTYGFRPVLGRAVSRFLNSYFPYVHARRQDSNLSRSIPDWISANPRIRESILEGYRQEQQRLISKNPIPSFYQRELWETLNNPLTSMDMEDMYESTRQYGIQKLSPFHDADLVEFVCRIPPLSLIKNNMTKGFLRRYLDVEFPELGFTFQKKTGASSLLWEIISSESKQSWEIIDGAKQLVEMGIVNPDAIQEVVQKVSNGKGDAKDFHDFWMICNTEMWLRNSLHNQVY